MGGYDKALRGLKTLALFLSLVFAFPDVSLAMGDRQPAPDCLASDTLRVEIGGEQFAFPRKMVRSMRGADVKHVKYDQPTSTGSDACQKPEDRAWNLEYLSLDIYPKPCNDPQECNVKIIYSDITNVSTNSSDQLSESPFPHDKQALLAKCRPPAQPLSDGHAKYWTACNYVFVDGGMILRIKFRGGADAYPPEDIDETKKLVRQEIDKYKY